MQFNPTPADRGISTWGSKYNWAQGYNLPNIYSGDTTKQKDRFTPVKGGDIKNTLVLCVKFANMKNTFDFPVGITLMYKPIGSFQTQYLPFPGATHTFAGNDYHYIIPANFSTINTEMVYRTTRKIDNEYGELYPHITGDPSTINANYTTSFQDIAANIDHPVVKRAIDNLAFYKNWNIGQNGEQTFFLQATRPGENNKLLINPEIWAFCAKEIQEQVQTNIDAIDLSTIVFEFTLLKTVPRNEKDGAQKMNITNVFNESGQVSFHSKFLYCFRDIKESYIVTTQDIEEMRNQFASSLRNNGTLFGNNDKENNESEEEEEADDEEEDNEDEDE